MTTSSKTEFLNVGYEIEKVKDEKVEILFDQSLVNILINGEEENKMTGVINATECNWKTPYKEDKTIIRA